MKKKALAAAGIIAALIVLFGVFGGFYTVGPNEYAAVRQFGKIVATSDTPGLKLKVPFIQNVQHVSRATTLYDVPLSDVITRDKKSMIADNYVLWRVADPIKYIRTLDAIDIRAEERIEAAVYNALKNVISSMTQDEVIEARGERLTQLLTEEANSDIGDYGIEVLTAEIKSLDLPDDNKQAVMEADAKKQAEILTAEGEAEYMKILSKAYDTEDKADFYNFMRSLDALKGSLSGKEKTIILDKDSDLVKVLYGNENNAGK